MRETYGLDGVVDPDGGVSAGLGAVVAVVEGGQVVEVGLQVANGEGVDDGFDSALVGGSRWICVSRRVENELGCACMGKTADWTDKQRCLRCHHFRRQTRAQLL